jgi:hypothetical protein
MQIFAVNGNLADLAVDEFLAQTGITFPALHDIDKTKDQLAVTTAISPYPKQVIIGPDGTILYQSHDYNSETVHDVLFNALHGLGVYPESNPCQ